MKSKYSQTRCNDGFCRRNCSAIEYSNCAIDTPFKCGDGRCVKFEFQCASSSCPFDRPYLCPDMTCSNYIKNCRDTLAYRPFKEINVVYSKENARIKMGVDVDGVEQNNGVATVFFTARTNYRIFAPPDNSPNIAKFNGTLNGNATLKIAPMAFSQVKDVVNNVTENYTISIDRRFHFKNMTVPSYFTARSPVLTISTSGRIDDNEYFGTPLLVKFNYDPLMVEEGRLNITTLRVGC